MAIRLVVHISLIYQPMPITDARMFQLGQVPITLTINAVPWEIKQFLIKTAFIS